MHDSDACYCYGRFPSGEQEVWTSCRRWLCQKLPKCTDGERNGDEERIDCGGSCPACVTPLPTQQVIVAPLALPTAWPTAWPTSGTTVFPTPAVQPTTGFPTRFPTNFPTLPAVVPAPGGGGSRHIITCQLMQSVAGFIRSVFEARVTTVLSRITDWGWGTQVGVHRILVHWVCPAAACPARQCPRHAHERRAAGCLRGSDFTQHAAAHTARGPAVPLQAGSVYVGFEAQLANNDALTTAQRDSVQGAAALHLRTESHSGASELVDIAMVPGTASLIGFWDDAALATLPPTSSASDDDDSSLPWWGILLIVLGVLLCCGLAVAVFCLLKKPGKGKLKGGEQKAVSPASACRAPPAANQLSGVQYSACYPSQSAMHPDASRSMRSGRDLQYGDKVVALWNGEWHPGTVWELSQHASSPPRVCVLWEDGSRTRGVPAADVRLADDDYTSYDDDAPQSWASGPGSPTVAQRGSPPRGGNSEPIGGGRLSPRGAARRTQPDDPALCPGARVVAPWGGAMHPGTLSAVNKADAFATVLWEDGTHITGVALADVLLLAEKQG